MSEDNKNDISVIKVIVDRIVDIFYYSGMFLEISVCIVIASSFFKKRHHPSSSSSCSSLSFAYFYILFFLYLFDALYELGFTCQRYLTKDWNSSNAINLPWINLFENFLEWFIMLFLGPTNVLLSLNRFTAIFLIIKHKILWIKWFPLILTLLFMYPFFVGGFTFFTNFHCRFDIYDSACLEFFKSDFYRSAISNIFCSILSLIIGISTALMYRKKFSSAKKSAITARTKELKIEHKLLLQSLLSSIMFGCFAIGQIFFPFFYEHRDDSDLFIADRIYQFVQDFLYISYHYVSIILLFVFS